jgi:anthranilate synthase component I
MKLSKKIRINTKVTRELADIHTPVGIYLRLRDRFRDTILLESTDSHAAENSFSFIGVNAIGGVEVGENRNGEVKYPGKEPKSFSLKGEQELSEIFSDFMDSFETSGDDPSAKLGQGIFGYCSFDSIPFVEKIKFRQPATAENKIPIARYRLYQYIIAINHYRDELLLIENCIEGLPSESDVIGSLIRSRDVPSFPFSATTAEASNMDDESFLQMVEKGIQSCLRGDVFQVVLSRRYQQSFHGDEFNVYRALRNINPSPYLFYFDYGDYKLMGSSPEAQLVIKDRKAIVHPIAGTFRRTGNEVEDLEQAQALLADPKENAEHVMLVDLARNDLSTICKDVKVASYRQIQYFSHVIHLVSKVTGELEENVDPFKVLFKTFPAGTLSGAPKFRAMQLISEYEPDNRSFYGGTIGFVGLDGSMNQAIMIRSFLSRNNELFYQAGAGVVAASDPATELEEVKNKLGALKKAIVMAAGIHQH